MSRRWMRVGILGALGVAAALALLLVLRTPPVLDRRPAGFDVDGTLCDLFPVQHEGRVLPWWDAPALELHVWRNSDDGYARLILLGYYEMHVYDLFSTEEGYVDTYTWFVDHHPRSAIVGSPTYLPTAGGRLVAAWSRRLAEHPNDRQFLLDAAATALFPRPRVAETYLLRAHQHYPDDAEIAYELAHFYDLQWDEVGLSRDEASHRIFALYRRAIELAPASSMYLASAGQAALNAGELAYADSYGQRLLALAPGSDPDEASDALHRGHVIVGRVALRRGDTEAAKAHLLAAADVTGSPTLDSFGPNMSLAKDLLEVGESAVVLAYLDGLHAFWEAGCDGSLDSWASEIRAGEVPDFGANLVY